MSILSCHVLSHIYINIGGTPALSGLGTASYLDRGQALKDADTASITVARCERSSALRGSRNAQESIRISENCIMRMNEN